MHSSRQIQTLYIHTCMHAYRAKKDLEKALKTADEHLSRQTKEFALLTTKCDDLQYCLGAKDGVSMYVCMCACIYLYLCV